MHCGEPKGRRMSLQVSDKKHAKEVHEEASCRVAVSDHDQRQGADMGCARNHLQTRNARYVRSVMGCELRRQLREPGAGCGCSMVPTTWFRGVVRASVRLELQSGQSFAISCSGPLAAAWRSARPAEALPTGRSCQQLRGRCQASIKVPAAPLLGPLDDPNPKHPGLDEIPPSPPPRP